MRTDMDKQTAHVPASTAEVSALQSRVRQCEGKLLHFAQVECELRNRIDALQTLVNRQLAK